MVVLVPEREILVIVGGITIYWYGFLYLLAFAIAAVLLPKLFALRGIKLSSDQRLLLLVACMAGVIMGGRLGYVIGYEPAYYLDKPLEIFNLSQGGMASHGAFLGVVVAVWYASYRLHLTVRQIADALVIPIAIGLSLGRIGNFINHELYGIVTMLPWGVAVPDVAGLRHPVQLYAALKNGVVALLCVWFFYRVKPVIAGQTAAVFLVTYSSLRILVDEFRVPDRLFELAPGITLSQAQLLTLPLLVVGVWLWLDRPVRKMS